MRWAELIMAGVMALFSSYLMWKSTELPIGWIPGEGPGGGAFSFWLSTGMLICTAWIVLRWFRGSSPPSQSTKPYMEKQSFRLFAIVAGSLTIMIASIHVVGVYVALPFFLIFYMKFLGRHSWLATASLALAIPIGLFFFFEIALRITLPKGLTEPLFYPLYDIFL